MLPDNNISNSIKYKADISSIGCTSEVCVDFLFLVLLVQCIKLLLDIVLGIIKSIRTYTNNEQELSLQSRLSYISNKEQISATKLSSLLIQDRLSPKRVVLRQGMGINYPARCYTC